MAILAPPWDMKTKHRDHEFPKFNRRLHEYCNYAFSLSQTCGEVKKVGA